MRSFNSHRTYNSINPVPHSLRPPSQVHYPIPPHKQEALTEYAALSLPVTEQIHREELSLPMSPLMTVEEVAYVIAAINKFE